MSEQDEGESPDPSVRYGRGVGGWASDVLEEARNAVLEVMRGAGGRNALARLQAAKTVLDKEWLAQLSDEALVAEMKRRHPEGK